MKYRLQEAQASTKNWTLNIRYIFSGQCYSYALYKLHKRSASFCIRHHYDSQNWGKGCHGDICWLPFTSTSNCSSSLSLSCPTHSVLYRLLQKKEKNIHTKMKEKNVASHFCGLFLILVFSRDTWDETETWDWGFLVACVNVRKLNSEDKQEVKCKLNFQLWKMRPTEKSQKRKCISSHGHSIDSLWPHIRGLTKSPHSFFLKHSWDRSTSISAFPWCISPRVQGFCNSCSRRDILQQTEISSVFGLFPFLFSSVKKASHPLFESTNPIKPIPAVRAETHRWTVGHLSVEGVKRKLYTNCAIFGIFCRSSLTHFAFLHLAASSKVSKLQFKICINTTPVCLFK